MHWTENDEEALQVITKIITRQLGLPEKTLLITDVSTWNKIHPEDKHDFDKLTGLSSIGDYHILVNVDKCSNFYDCVACVAHELFHHKRPKLDNEYRINRLAEKWLNCNIYRHIPDMSKV